MSKRLAFAPVGIGAFIAASAIFACSLRDTSYLQAGGGPTPLPDGGGGDDAPVNPDTGSGATRTATVIASGQVAPQFLTQDDGTLYWTGEGKIFALKKDGSETAPREVTAAAAGITFLVAEEGAGPNLFFTSGKEIKVVPKAGGTPTSIATTNPAPVALAVDPTYVFAAANDPDAFEAALMRYTHDGMSPTVVRAPDEASEVVAVALQGTDVWWDEGTGDFFSLPRNTGPDAGAKKYSVSGQDVEYSYTPLGFAVDEKAIYYSNGTEVRAFAKTATGTPTQLINYEDTSEITAIAVDDKYVYAIDSRTNGTLRRNTKDKPGTPELMLDGLAKPTSIAVDATSVYLTIEGPAGTIVKCAK